MNPSPSALNSDVTVPQVIFWPRQPGRRTIHKLILADWAVRQFKEKYHLSFQPDPSQLFFISSKTGKLRFYLKLMGNQYIEILMSRKNASVTLHFANKNILLQPAYAKAFRELLRSGA